jgi:hypothetical protein
MKRRIAVHFERFRRISLWHESEEERNKRGLQPVVLFLLLSLCPLGEDVHHGKYKLNSE